MPSVESSVRVHVYCHLPALKQISFLKNLPLVFSFAESTVSCLQANWSYNHASYNQDSYNKRSYNQDSYNQGSYNQGSYNQDSYNQESYNQESYNQDSYNKGTLDYE